MTLSERAKQERKKILTVREQLSRVTGSGGEVPYAPGETWRNNKMYLLDDSVKDSNGNPYTALQDSRNKPPANNPLYWKRQGTVVTRQRWSDIPVGTLITVGTPVVHNSKDWTASTEHTKTAGNGPRQGSTLWVEG